MTFKKFIVAFVLFDFALLNVVAMASEGFSGLAELVTEGNLWTAVLSFDIVIALSMVVMWLWNDARERGHNPVGYVVLTVLSGSIGPLLYLLRRDDAEEPKAAATSLGARHA